uniref:Set1/Ash2 histone methyltransferase complex subunit ASH2 n=1 Tax=Magallana gigas TaxID=29159 RepID=A0A8W8MI21_MAGGI
MSIIVEENLITLRPPLVKFKSHLYYEEKDHVAETEKSLKPLIGSQMIMYKNGSSQGIAYEDVFEGVYYPAVSLYKNTKVTMNFGPDFKCPPQGLKDFRPMSDAASQTMVEYALADIIYHVENEGKLPEF